jgi:hypothetical protein
MKGIYLDETESFGFYDTTRDQFINVSGLFIFDSCAEFYNAHDDNCEFDFERLNSVITNKWRNKIYDEK